SKRQPRAKRSRARPAPALSPTIKEGLATESPRSCGRGSLGCCTGKPALFALPVGGPPVLSPSPWCDKRSPTIPRSRHLLSSDKAAASKYNRSHRTALSLLTRGGGVALFSGGAGDPGSLAHPFPCQGH